MNDSVLIKTKMVTIGTDIHFLVHATACADFDNKFERKTQSTRFHQTSQANKGQRMESYNNSALSSAQGKKRDKSKHEAWSLRTN